MSAQAIPPNLYNFKSRLMQIVKNQKKNMVFSLPWVRFWLRMKRVRGWGNGNFRGLRLMPPAPMQRIAGAKVVSVGDLKFMRVLWTMGDKSMIFVAPERLLGVQVVQDGG